MALLHTVAPALNSSDSGESQKWGSRSFRTQQITAEQTQLLYTHAPTGLVVTLLNTGLVAFGLRNVVSLPMLSAWCVVMLGITLARFVLLQQYRRAAPPIDQSQRWRVLFIFWAGCAGLGWGSAGCLLFPSGSLPHQLFLAFVLGGMITGGVAVLSPVYGAFVAFAVPTALPLTTQFFLQGEEFSFAMGGMAFVFSGALLIIGRHLHLAMTESLTLRFDKQLLIHDLSMAEQHAAAIERAQAALLEAKKAAEAANRAKSEFLATMSHELRTPLHIILGYTDLLREGDYGVLSPEQETPLYRIDSSARELLDLITAALDMSRLEAGHLPLVVSPIDIGELFTEIQREMPPLQEQSPLSFVWQVAEPLPQVQTDPHHLKVIVKNLLGNAVKFTEEGQITIVARSCMEGVEIQVVDTGIGIAPDALAQIFEPFYQLDSSPRRKYGGTGLGLHIVKRLVELLGGTVKVESRVGRGSTFRVWVPIHPNS